MSNLSLAPIPEVSPESIEQLLSRLPARHRASLAWAPRHLEMQFTEPLAAIEDAEELNARLPGLMVAFAMINVRIGLAMLELGQFPELSGLIADTLAERSADAHAAIAGRLDPVDPTAADQLREAYEIARVIVPLVTAVAFSSGPRPRPTSEPSRDEIRAELDGRGGDYLRLIALLGSALGAVRASDSDLPPLLPQWCELAWSAGWAIIDDLRRHGMPVPSIRIPGFSRREWRQRWASRVLTGLDDAELAEIEESTVRSEARRAPAL